MSNTCKYWDCGWCYALDNVETNADSQSACVNPSFCPYLVRDEAMRPEVVDLPQANSDVCGEEGMERALQRTFEENDELMRKLSDS